MAEYLWGLESGRGVVVGVSCGRRKIVGVGDGLGGGVASSCCRRRGRWRGPPPTAAKDIDPAPAIDIIWRTRVAALSRSDMDSRVIQRIAARRKLVSQARNSRP